MDGGGGLSVGGFESGCECEACVQLSARMRHYFVDCLESIPYKAAAGAELNSVIWVCSAVNHRVNHIALCVSNV